MSDTWLAYHPSASERRCEALGAPLRGQFPRDILPLKLFVAFLHRFRLILRFAVFVLFEEVPFKFLVRIMVERKEAVSSSNICRQREFREFLLVSPRMVSGAASRRNSSDTSHVSMSLDNALAGHTRP